jgi:hypothetical protein
VFDSFKSSSGISDCCSSSGSDVIASDVIEVITIDGGSSDSTRISVSSGVICVCLMFPSHRILYSAGIVEKFSRDLSIERSTSEYILAKNLSRVGFVVNDLIAKEAVGSTREHTC